MKPNDQRPAAATAPRDAASDVWSKRGETIEDKISQLDAEVIRYKEQIKKTRPGPAQEVVKARMKRKIRQKRAYERQRDILHNRSFGANQVSLAKEKIKDSKQKSKIDEMQQWDIPLCRRWRMMKNLTKYTNQTSPRTPVPKSHQNQQQWGVNSRK